MRMSLWTIYDHPTDFPEHYVAREWIAAHGTVHKTENFIMSKNLDMLRGELQSMHKYPIERAPTDDPKIVETWI